MQQLADENKIRQTHSPNLFIGVAAFYFLGPSYFGTFIWNIKLFCFFGGGILKSENLPYERGRGKYIQHDLLKERKGNFGGGDEVS